MSALATTMLLAAIGAARGGEGEGAGDAPVADFLLESADGARTSLWQDSADRKATVIAFTSVGCPIAKLLAPRLGRYEKEYRERGVRFLGIDPNIQDSAKEIATFAKDAGIVASVEKKRISALLLYHDNSNTGRVLLKAP